MSDVVNEKVVSERGTGGATFAAILMIIGGTFGIFEGLSLIVGGTYYVQPANYWITYGRGHVGLGAPDFWVSLSWRLGLESCLGRPGPAGSASSS